MGIDYRFQGSSSYPRFNKEISQIAELFGGVKNERYKAEECTFGIFCNRIHSKNEYYYHPKIFRKKIECTRDKKNGHCMFIKTCYGNHQKEEYELYEKELKEIDENIRNNDEDIKELNKKIDIINNIADVFKCRSCNKVPNGKIKYLCECKHFLCKKCFEENDKECPFCEKKSSKKNTLNLYFIRKNE